MFKQFLTPSNLLHTHSTPNTTTATYTTLAVLEHYPTSTLTFSLSLRNSFMHIWCVCVCMPLHCIWEADCDRNTAGTDKDTYYIYTIFWSICKRGGAWEMKNNLDLSSWYTGASILHHQTGRRVCLSVAGITHWGYFVLEMNQIHSAQIVILNLGHIQWTKCWALRFHLHLVCIQIVFLIKIKSKHTNLYENVFEITNFS